MRQRRQPEPHPHQGLPAVVRRIKDKVVFIGAGFHIELWSLENRPAMDGAEIKVVSELLAHPKFLKKVGLKKDDDDDA